MYEATKRRHALILFSDFTRVSRSRQGYYQGDAAWRRRIFGCQMRTMLAAMLLYFLLGCPFHFRV